MSKKEPQPIKLEDVLAGVGRKLDSFRTSQIGKAVLGAMLHGEADDAVKYLRELTPEQREIVRIGCTAVIMMIEEEGLL